MRLLCLDVGDKKIGISISDSNQSIAFGLKVYRRDNNVKGDLEEIKRLVVEHDIKEIVIGLPKDLKGRIGKRASDIISFSKEVERHLSIPVVLWDERFSTNEAHRVFEIAEINHKKRRPYLDTMAAQIILQGYLDAKNKG